MCRFVRCLLPLFLLCLALVAIPDRARADDRPNEAAVADYIQFRRFWNEVASPEEQEAVDRDPAVAEATFRRFEAKLRADEARAEDVARIGATLRRFGVKRLEVELWNVVLTGPDSKLKFNHAPNAFLVDVVKGLAPGRALDVGMGQGRNAIFLAQKGWDVTGFDPADRAVAAATVTASALGLDRHFHGVVADETFDFGKDQWDLIVICYAGGREWVKQVLASLKPGGILVIESFKGDETRAGAVVRFADNELLHLFEGLRVLRYEDTRGIGDFGMAETSLVRLAAQRRHQ